MCKPFHRKIIGLLLGLFPLALQAQWNTTSITAFRQYRIECSTGKDCMLIASDFGTDSLVTVFRTKNSGATWNRIDQGLPLTKRPTKAFQRLSTDTCYYANEKLYKTTDGGQNWNQIEVAGFTDQVTVFHFPSNQYGYLWENYFKKLRRSNDHGQSWQEVAHNLPMNSHKHIKILRFTDKNEGHALVIDTNLGWQYLYKTINGGLNWQQTWKDTLQFELNDITFSDRQIGYACGQFGTSLKTQDGGQSWQIMNNLYIGSSETNFQAMDSYGVNSLLLVSNNARVIRTLTSGNLWDDISPQWGNFADVDIVNHDTVFLLNHWNYIQINTSAGLMVGLKSKSMESWRVYPIPAEDQVQIDSELKQEAVLRLYNLQGQLQHEMQVEKNPVLIERGNLGAGMYLYELQEKGGQKTSGKIQFK